MTEYTVRFKPEPMTANPMCECGDCGLRECWDSLVDIEDIDQRINAGSVVPAGECSQCGSLSYVEPMKLQAEDVLTFDEVGQLIQLVRHRMAADSSDPEFRVKLEGIKRKLLHNYLTPLDTDT